MTRVLKSGGQFLYTDFRRPARPMPPHKARTQPVRRRACSSRSRTSVTASMCSASPWFGCQARKGESPTAAPRPVSQTNEGASTASLPEPIQPARFQRSLSARAVWGLRPITRPSCGSVMAYCSPTR